MGRGNGNSIKHTGGSCGLKSPTLPHLPAADSGGELYQKVINFKALRFQGDFKIILFIYNISIGEIIDVNKCTDSEKRWIF